MRILRSSAGGSPSAAFSTSPPSSRAISSEQAVRDDRARRPSSATSSPLAALVAVLDQEPGAASPSPAARPACARAPTSRASFLPSSANLSSPFCERRVDVGRLRRPRAAVPDHHRAAAVLALRDDALELGVLDRVVLDLHREPLDRRIERRTLRHRPREQHALPLEPEVVVERGRAVLLDDERERLRRARTFGVFAPAGSGVTPKRRFFRYSASGLPLDLSFTLLPNVRDILAWAVTVEALGLAVLPAAAPLLRQPPRRGPALAARSASPLVAYVALGRHAAAAGSRSIGACSSSRSWRSAPRPGGLTRKARPQAAEPRLWGREEKPARSSVLGLGGRLPRSSAPPCPRSWAPRSSWTSRSSTRSPATAPCRRSTLDGRKDDQLLLLGIPARGRRWRSSPASRPSSPTTSRSRRSPATPSAPRPASALRLSDGRPRRGLGAGRRRGLRRQRRGRARRLARALRHGLRLLARLARDRRTATRSTSFRSSRSSTRTCIRTCSRFPSSSRPSSFAHRLLERGSASAEPGANGGRLRGARSPWLLLALVAGTACAANNWNLPAIGHPARRRRRVPRRREDGACRPLGRARRGASSASRVAASSRSLLCLPVHALLPAPEQRPRADDDELGPGRVSRRLGDLLRRRASGALAARRGGDERARRRGDLWLAAAGGRPRCSPRSLSGCRRCCRSLFLASLAILRAAGGAAGRRRGRRAGSLHRVPASCSARDDRRLRVHLLQGQLRRQDCSG